MKSFIKFAKTSGIYFFGTVLAKLVTMLLLRVYTEYIPAEDMGTYNVSINYVTFPSCIWISGAGFSGIFMTIIRRKDRKSPSTAGLLFLGSRRLPIR